jgi:RNA polymerase sigma-70 factor (ECF subfamily)
MRVLSVFGMKILTEKLIMGRINNSIHLQQVNLSGLMRGEKKAFESVYMDYYDMLFHLANGYIGNREVAKELVQDAFLKLWEYREDLGKNTNIKNFLYTLTKNSSLNYLKQQEVICRNNREYLLPELKYRQEALSEFPDSYAGVEDLLGRVDNAIEKLPEEVRVTFKMNRFDGLTYNQIAEKLEVSPKTVEARISKALKILRSELKDCLPAVQLIFLLLRL